MVTREAAAKLAYDAAKRRLPFAFYPTKGGNGALVFILTDMADDTLCLDDAPPKELLHEALKELREIKTRLANAEIDNARHRNQI